MKPQRLAAGLSAVVLMAGAAGACRASDHLDSPAVIADPRADIGDLYAWTDPGGRKLNLAMTIVGHSFSDRLDYVFHIDSGRRLGKTTQTTTLTCHFATMTAADCRLGELDRAQGDASHEAGLESTGGRFRVFAGLRDDPFFNNVRGSRDAFQVAIAALKAGAPVDAAGCPQFDPATVRAILDRWRHTDGGPAKNFLAGWTPASIVVSVDLKAVAGGGPLVGVWAATVSPERQIDRAGRPLTGNALTAPLEPAAVSDPLKDAYNRTTPDNAFDFVPIFQKSLGLYDGYDGTCGDGFLASSSEDPDVRYGPLALLLADDRLWVNSAETHCSALFAVERATLGREPGMRKDCGGRAPSYSASNQYRSLLAGGRPVGIDDGVNQDDQPVSDSVFPFLAAPGAKP